MTAPAAPLTPLEVAVHDLREIIALRESPDLTGVSPEEIYEQQSVTHHGRITTSGLRVVLDTLDECRARLAAVEGERDAVVSAVCAFSEQVAQLQGESVSADDVMRWLDAHLHPTHALTPATPTTPITPTEGNES